MLTKYVGLFFALLFATDLAASEEAHTASASVRVLTTPLLMSATGGGRTLRVYVPRDYRNDATRYPVIYMFDGQNLFDNASSFAGEWNVDESMDALARESGIEAIVVGIDNGGAQRINELIPYFNAAYAPNRGTAFIDDLVATIKPYIDANFRTRPARESTVIMGSSLGGLEANAAIQRYPQVFVAAGVFSPSFWVSNDAFAESAASRLPPDARIYLYIGGGEGDDAVFNTQRMAGVLRMRMPPPHVILRVVPGAAHNEAAWRSEFPRAARWLLAGMQVSPRQPETP